MFSRKLKKITKKKIYQRFQSQQIPDIVTKLPIKKQKLFDKRINAFISNQFLSKQAQGSVMYK